MTTAYTGKFGSRAELWKGGFGKLFRDPGRKITSPRRAPLLGGGGKRALVEKRVRERGKRFLSETDANVTVCSGTRYIVEVSRAREQQRYGGWMVNWLKTFSTRWLAPPTPTFQSNRFLAQHGAYIEFSTTKILSIFVYVHEPFPPSSLSFRPPKDLSLASSFSADPIHNTLSSFPLHRAHLRFPRSSFPRSRTLPLKARNFLHRETLSGMLHVTLPLRCLFD